MGSRGAPPRVRAPHGANDPTDLGRAALDDLPDHRDQPAVTRDRRDRTARCSEAAIRRGESRSAERGVRDGAVDARARPDRCRAQARRAASRRRRRHDPGGRDRRIVGGGLRQGHGRDRPRWEGAAALSQAVTDRRDLEYTTRGAAARQHRGRRGAGPAGGDAVARGRAVTRARPGRLDRLSGRQPARLDDGLAGGGLRPPHPDPARRPGEIVSDGRARQPPAARGRGRNSPGLVQRGRSRQAAGVSDRDDPAHRRASRFVTRGRNFRGSDHRVRPRERDARRQRRRDRLGGGRGRRARAARSAGFVEMARLPDRSRYTVFPITAGVCLRCRCRCRVRSVARIRATARARAAARERRPAEVSLDRTRAHRPRRADPRRRPVRRRRSRSRVRNRARRAIW